MQNKKRCPDCFGSGEFWAECCNGAGGCSCQGQPMLISQCQACLGTGLIDDNYTKNANVNFLRKGGYGFIGTGPKYGTSIYDSMPRLGLINED